MKRFLSISILVLYVSGCAKHGSGTTSVDVSGENGGSVKVDAPGAHVEVGGEGNQGRVTVDTPDAKVKIRGQDEGGTVEVQGKDGGMKAGANVTVSESELGLKFYPGAKYTNGVRAEGGGAKAFAVTLETSDSMDQVLRFYDSAFPYASKSKGDTVSVKRVDGGSEYELEVSRSDGKTQIGLSRKTK